MTLSLEMPDSRRIHHLLHRSIFCLVFHQTSLKFSLGLPIFSLSEDQLLSTRILKKYTLSTQSIQFREFQEM